MFQYTEAFSDQVSLLSHFNRLFELLGPGFHRLLLLYIRIKLKNIFKTLIANFMNNVARMLLIQSLLECKVCLSHAGPKV